MCPELWTRRLVASPVTQIWPICFSSNRLICSVSSLTESTRRICSVGNSSPKSHCDFGFRSTAILQRPALPVLGAQRFVRLIRIGETQVWSVPQQSLARQLLLHLQLKRDIAEQDYLREW